MVSKRLSIKWNPMRIGGPAHGKVIIINCTQNSAKGCTGLGCVGLLLGLRVPFHAFT